MRNLQYLTLYPWQGGLNTSQDPIVLDPQQLQLADNIVFTTQGSRKKRGGQAHFNTTAITVSSVAQTMIWETDYWANVSNTKRQYAVAISSQGNAFRSTNGVSWNKFNTATLTVSHGAITSTVFNEDLIIGTSGTTPPRKWDNQSTSANIVVLGGSPPNGNIVQSNQNRVWLAGNVANRDRLYYSGVTNHEAWSATSALGTTSGYIDVMPGDGDSDGITSLFPELKQGGIYVAKRTHLYFVDTSQLSPATWRIYTVSTNTGCVNHNTACAIDQEDIFFCAERGVTSLAQVVQGTNLVKDGQYISAYIQPDYMSTIDQATKSKMSAVWYETLNSYMFSCKRSGVATYETVYCFNTQIKQWYRWTGVPCNFLNKRFDKTNGLVQLAASADSGYINKLNQTALNDFGGAIPLSIKTAAIYPGGIVPGEKHFTNLIFLFRSKGTYTFGYSYNIDETTTGSGTIQQRVVGQNVLGTTLLGPAFVLGVTSNRVKPYFEAIAGVGHSIEVTITQSGVNEDLEIFGFGLEFKGASEAQNPYRSLS